MFFWWKRLLGDWGVKGPAVKGRCMRRRVVAGVGNGAAWACWVTSYSTNLPNHREAITQRGPWSAAKDKNGQLVRILYATLFLWHILITVIYAAFLLKLLPPASPSTGYYWYIPTEYLKTSNSKCFMASGIMAEVCWYRFEHLASSLKGPLIVLPWASIAREHGAQHVSAFS